MKIRVYVVDKDNVAVRFKDELKVAHMAKSFTEDANFFALMKILRKSYLYLDITEAELGRMELLMEQDA